MAWTAEQARSYSAAAAKKAGETHTRKAQARKLQPKPVVWEPSSEPSAEVALERRIAKLTARGARPCVIDKLSIILERLRKSARKAIKRNSHNINYLQYSSIGSVATQPLTQTKPAQPEATTTPSVPGSKESLSLARPVALGGVVAAAGPPGESVSTLSTSTPPILESPRVPVVNSQPLRKDPRHAPWAPLAGAIQTGKVTEPVKSERKEVPCPGPGYVKVKVGKYWVWSKPNADYRPGFKR